MTGRTSGRRACAWLLQWLAVSAALIFSSGAVHAERAFAPRFTTNDNGVIQIVGNTLMSCTQGANNPPATCLASVPVSGTGATGGNLDDNNYTMRLVNTAGGTASSSSADLALPVGSSVVWAGLYWGADTSAGANGTADAAPANRGQIRFAVPGGAYQLLTASQVDAATTAGQANRFSAFLDVTARVQAAGSGTYRAADIHAGTGGDRYAGWSLVIVVHDPAQPLRNLAVFDGYQAVSSAATTVSVTVSGFLTPLSGAFTTRAGAVAYEGDLGQTGDQFRINGTAISNGVNPADNVFNSTISSFGTNATAKNPNFVNQMGFDADQFDASGILANGATSATLTFTTGGETYFPAVLTLANDVYQPIVEGNVIKTVTDLNGGTVLPGDVLQYSISVANTGNDGATNVVLNDAIPANTTYVPGSLAVVAGANAGAKTDAAGDDQANFTGTATVFRLGTGATATSGGSLAINGSTTITFQVQVNAGVVGGTTISNQASVAYNSATLGTSFNSLSDGDPSTAGNQPTTVVVGSSQSRLSIEKEGTPNPVTAGQNITYTLHVANSGPSAATAVVVSDPLAAGTVFVSATAPAGWTVTAPAVGANGTVTFTAATLPVGTYDLVIVAKVAAGTAGGTVIGNSATESATNDPSGPHSASTNTTVAISDDLALSKSADAVVGQGQQLDYTLQLNNPGPDTATGVVISDPLPANTTFVSATAPPGWTIVAPAVGAAGTVTFSIAALPPGSYPFAITVTASPTATIGSTITNTATVSSTSADSNLANNTASAGSLVQNPLPRVVKSFTPASVGVGVPSTMRIAITNTAGVPISGIAISDTLPTTPGQMRVTNPATGVANTCGGTFTAAANAVSVALTGAGPLAAGATCFVEVNVVATTVGTYINTTGNVTSTQTPAGPPASATLTVTALSAPTTTKSFTPASVPLGGSTQMTVAFANPNATAIVGVAFLDTYPTGLANASGTVLASNTCGGTVTAAAGGNALQLTGGTIPVAGCSIVVNVVATAVGNVVNTTGAITSTNAPTGAGASGTLVVTPSANVSVVKTGPATIGAGGAISYSVVVSNAGPSTANGTTFSDAVPAGITGVAAVCGSATGGGVCGAVTVAGNNVSSTITTLPSGSSVTFTITGTAPANPATLSNTASATAPTGTTDPDTSNNSSTVSTTVTPVADISAVKTGPASIGFGGALTYSVLVSNAGPTAANGTTFTDTLPAGLTGVTATCGTVTGGAVCGTVTASATSVTSTITTLPSGSSVTFTINATAPTSGTSITNSATANPPTGTSDPVPGNNTGTATTNLLQPTLTVTKTATPNPFVVGQTASYAITVTNSGAGPTAGNITIADTLPTGITLASATGTNWTCTGTTALSCTFTGTVAAGGNTVLTLNVNVGAAATNGNNSATATGGGDTTCPAAAHCTGTVTNPVTPSADIRAVKTGPASIGFGGALTYSVVVSNLGPSGANGTTFTDTLPAGLTGVTATCGTVTGGAVCGTVTTSATSVTSTITTLPNGGSVTFTINATAPTSGTSITNSATANPPSGTSDPTSGNNTSSVNTNLLQPQLTVTKTATPNPFVVGQAASYAITVTNTGAGPTSGNITIADTLPTGITLASAAGTNWTCTGTTALSCTYTGTIAAAGSTVLTLNVNVGATATTGNNSASATGGGDPTCSTATPPARCTGTVTTTVNASADIAITKSVNNAAPNVGDSVTFTVTATNNGPNNATGVAVTDALPSGLAFVSATPSQGTYVSATGLWTVGSITNGGSATLQIVATVLTPGSITNTATKTAGNQFDPNTGNNAGSATLNANPTADLQITKTVNNATPNLGAAVTFTITLHNAGPNNATGIVVDDLLPAGLNYVSSAASQGTYADATGVWTVGAVANGANATLAITATVSLPGDITNTASIFQAVEHDPNPANNSSGVTINGQSSDIQVVKMVDNANPIRGDTVTFTITATNNGPSAATGVAITDALPAGLALVSATAAPGTTYNTTTGVWTIGAMAATGAGATKVLTIVATVNTDAGFTNTAALTALDQTDPNPANNSSSVVVTPVASADIRTVKTGPASIGFGGALTYSVVVSNLGPSGANGTTFTDTLPAGLTGVTATCGTVTGGAVCGTVTTSATSVTSTITTLPNGGSVTFTINATAPTSGTSITNSATANPPTGTNDPVPGNNTGTATTNLLQPTLTVTKTATPNPFIVGQAASYAITVANTGAGPTTGNVTIADTLPTGITLASATGTNWTCTGTTALSCTFTGTIAAGANTVLTLNVNVGATATNGNNSATATGGGDTTCPAAAHCTGTVTNTVTPSADIRAVKTGPASIGFGGALSYSVVVSNLGPSAANGTTFTDTLPAGLTGVTATCGTVTGGAVCGTVTASATSVTSTITTLPSGSSVTFTINATAPTSGTSITNSATATPPTGTSDPVPGNNTGTATTNLLQPTLTVTKTATPNPFIVGQAASYAITVANTGAGPTTGNITIADTLPTGITLASAAGTNWTCTGTTTLSCTYTGTIAAAGSTVLTLNVNVGATATSGNNSATATGGGDTTCPAAAHCTGTVTNPVTPSADIRAVKTGPASIGFGGALTYSVVVSNLGPSGANGTTFTDTLPAGLTGVTATCGTPTGSAVCGTVTASATSVTSTITTLPNGGSVTFTINATAPTSGTSITNSATANPPTGTSDPVPGNNIGTATTNLLQPTLTVSKTATPNPFIVGQAASYAITVANTGAGPTTGNVTIADTLPTGITLASAAGTNWTCTGTTTLSCTYTGTIAAAGSTVLTLNVNVGANATTGNNSATATGGGDTTCPAAAHCTGTVTNPVNPSADIAVTKSVSNAAPNVGENVTFTVTATNNGPNNATGVAITDALPSGLSFISATPSQGTYVSATGLWTVGPITNGANATLQIVAKVLTPGAITNTATKTAGNQFDPDTGNNAGSASLNANPSADLQITKTVNNATPNLGTNIVYTITLTNAGPNDATNALVDDLLPAGLVFVSATASQGTYDAGTGLWTVGSVAAADTETLAITATVTLPGDITNTATVDADQNDPNPANNSSGVTLNGQSSDIQVVKGVDNANPVRGNTVTFTITATNNGPSPATGVAITDALPSGLLFVSATPSQGTYAVGTGIWTVGNLAATGAGATATLTVVATVDTDSGFTNTATLTALDQTDPNPANNSSSVVVTPIASANLAITKTDGATTAIPGSTIVYTIVATNAGPSTATGATITDTVPATITGATWTAIYAGAATGPANGTGNINATVTIPVGGSATFTLTGTISATATGTLANTASIAPPAGVTDPTPGNNSATDTDALTPTANLGITKDDGSTTYTPGGPISYTIVASNAGPSVATGAVVTDTIPAAITGATWSVVYAGGATGPANGTGNINATVNIPVGATATFTVTGTVSASATGTLANTASIAPPSGTNDPTPANNTATDSDNAAPSANLGITKTDGATSAIPGNPISYTIVATNAGPSVATGAIVTDTIPAAITGATWTAVYAGGATGPANGTGNINATVNIPVGATATFTVTGTVSASATGTLANTAAIAPPAGTTDPTPGDNTSTDTDGLAPTANLAISKTDGSNTYTPGGAISYTIVASNAGPSIATGAVVTDTIPAAITGATWTAVYGGGATGPANGTGNINATVNIPVGATATFTVTGTVSASATGVLANTTSIAPPSGTIDPTPADNTATDSDTAAPSANLGISKTDSSTTATPGGAITYTIVATNAGPSVATGAVIVDTIPGTITGATWTAVYAGGATGPASGTGNINATVNIPVGATATFTVTGTISATATGTLSNTATIAPPSGTTDPTPGDNSSTDTDTLNPSANLAITKTDGSATYTPGSAITYTIVATNAGPSTATGAVVTDTIPAAITGATWTAVYAGGATGPANGTGNVNATVTIPVGSTATFTVTGTVSAGATGTLANTATIAPPSGTTDPTPGDNSATDTDTANAQANLGITKTDGSATYTPGSPISYTIVASNAGPSIATGAVVTDTLPAAITSATWSVVYAGGATGPANGAGNINATVNIPVGATATFTLSGTVGAGATGSLVNTASIAAPTGTTDPNTANNSATDTDTAAPSADIAALKTGPASVGLGGALTYSVLVTNNGPSNANGTTFSDPLPAGITGVSASCGTPTGSAVCGAVNVAGLNVTSTITTLPSGGSVTFTINGTAPLTGTTIANTATANPPAGTTDPTSGNNSSTATTSLLPAQLTVTKTATPTPFVVGQPAQYTIAVQNTGSGTSNAPITVVDTLPTGITLASATGTNWTCTGTTALSCTFSGTLAPNATATLTLAVNVAASATTANNAATATGGGDPGCSATTPPARCTGTVVVTVVASADIAVTKVVDNATPNVGQNVVFTITAANNGPSNATGVAITDALPSGLSFVSATPSQGTFTSATGLWTVGALVNGANATLQITAKVLTPGVLTNTATKTAGDQLDPDTSNNAGSASLNAQPTADLQVLKTVDNAVPNLGTNVTFTITLTNAGPNDATGVVVSDALPLGLNFVLATPSQGTYDDATGLWTVGAVTQGTSQTLTLVATATLPGDVMNNASVSASNQFDPNPANNSSGADVNGQSADIQVIKTADNVNPIRGDTVTFTITASNNGPSNATGVAITDALPAGLAYVSSTASQGSYANGTGIWTVGSLAATGAGATATLTIVATVNTDAGFTNTATVTAAGQPDPNPANNSSSVVVTPVASSDLSITKTDGATTAVPGTPVTYTIVASNAGPSTATGATVVDTLPATITGATWTAVYSAGASGPASGAGNINATLTIPSGGTATFTLTGTISATATGTLANTATVTAPPGTTDPTPANNSATDSDTLVPTADIGVVKTGPANVVAGSSISYSVVVTNAGPSATSGATFVDAVPTAITGVSATCGSPTTGAACGAVTVTGNTVTSTITTLPSGGSVTFTILGTAPADPTSLSNTASAAPPTGVTDPDPTDNSSTANTTVTASADLSIVKTGPATVQSGAPISYTLLIANAGPSAADGATYSDAVPAGITGVNASCTNATGGAACANPLVTGNTVSGNVPAFPSGGSVTITISGDAPFGSQTLSNTATVASPAGVADPNTANNTSSASTTIGGAADIALTKAVNNVAPNVGDTVVFTITASNNGPNDASGVAVTDSLPAGLGFVSATPSQGTYTSGSGLWTIGGLANGDTVTLTITATVDQPGSLTNTVAVSAADQPDPDTSNNNAGASVGAGATADIGIAKSVDNSAPNVGDTVTYLLTVTNHGPNDATGVEATDHLPTGTTFVAALPSQGSYDEVGGVWTIGAVANGASATLAITVSVDAAGPITNTATLTHEDQFDPVGANNQAGTTINGQQADLGVTKTIDNATPNVGDTVTFTVTVHNNGPSGATSVALTDQLPAGLTFVSSTASQGAYSNVTGIWTVGALSAAGPTSSATLTVVATVVQAGPLVNTASVSASDQPDPNTTNNSGSAPLNGNPLANLAVDKSGPAVVTPGNDVVYLIVVTNNGPSDATNVIVTDPTPDGLTFAGNAGACTTAYPCSLGTIATGASATIATTYTVPANYTGANPITNTASATSATPDPDNTDNQSSAQTSVGVGNADLSLVKTAPATIPSGASITYTLAIANNGPSPANGASYDDNVPVGISAISASCGGATGGASCGTQPLVTGNSVNGTVGSLPSGGGVVITITGTAGTGPMTLTNTARITAPPGVNDPDLTNNSSTVSTGVGATSANLSVQKLGPASVSPGANVTYTLTVTNAGPDTAINAVLDDPTPTGLTFVSASTPCAAGFPCPLGDVVSGGSTIVTVTFAVPPDASGTITNTATIGSDTPDPTTGDNTSTVTTTVVPPVTSADLAVVKTGPASIVAGSNITYALQVTNNGPDAANNVMLSDATPAGLTFVSATAPCTAGFPCSLGALASGATTTVSVTFAVPSGIAGPIINTASASSDTPDPGLSNNTSTVTTTIVPGTTSADLAVVKSGPDTIAAGTDITYSLQVTNNGPDAATNVVLADATPTGLTFVSATAPCAAGFPCNLGTIASGASATVSVTFTVSAAATGSIVNTASTTSDTPDPDGSNNASLVTSTVIPVAGALADLVVTKTGPANAAAGSRVSYTITIQNQGPDGVPDAVLTDPTPAGLSYIASSAPCADGFPCAIGAIASGETVTVNVGYAVDDGFSGVITNIATANSATVPDPTPLNNASAVTTTVRGHQIPHTLAVPVDARWMLMLLAALLVLVAAPRAVRRR